MISDPMSRQDPFHLNDVSSPNGSNWTSESPVNIAQFVNPQYTDIRYSTTQRVFTTPELSPTDATPRRESFAISENRNTYFSDSSAASSFMSLSGCGTPSLSTPRSSASNSRRQSMLLPENQQYYYSDSPSPSNRPQRPKRAVASDQCLLPESSPRSHVASTDTASFFTDGAVACMSGGELTMAFDGYTGKAPRQWQSYSPQIDTSSLCGRAAQPAQFHEWTNCSRDLGAEIAARASHPIEFSQPLFGHPQPTIFDTAPPPGEEAYDTAGNCSPNALSLGAAFDGYHGKYPIEEGFGSDEMGPNVATAGRLYLSDGFIGQLPSDDDPEGYQATHSISKNRNRRQRRVKIERPETVSSRKPHRCFQCGYACERLEHLRRHKDSVHRPTMLPCAFQECKDTKADKHREIQSRFDNLKAHYTKTHFKYGSSEKGGKNERKSMKAAHGMGLSIYDHRWTLLLGDKMNLHVEIKDFLHVWKMLGYSIRETRDTKVKDVRPDWQVSDDQTLQKYDPRWKGLWNGTLTFDKAMSRGKDMSESEAEGLLGVTMLETEAMDIRDLDPRWTAMLDGRMSVELSEKLGVKQRNPLWKNLGPGRRAR